MKKFCQTAALGTGIFVGVWLFLMATRWGCGLSPDSFRYLDAARNLAMGRGFVITSGMGQFAPLTHFPPLYPALLALPTMVGFDTLSAARWIHLALFLANLWVIGRIMLLATASPSARAMCLFLGATSFILLKIHAMLWSEPLFLFFMLIAMLALLSDRVRPQGLLVIVSAVAFALSALTRYAGLCLVPIAGFFLLARPGAFVMRRIRDALLFGLVASLPPAAWMVRNLIASGSATNREILWHPVAPDILSAGLVSLAEWILPWSFCSQKTGGFFFVVIVLVFTWWFLFENRRSAVAARETMRLITLIAVGYTVFLFVALALADANIRLHQRIIFPVWVTLMIGLVCMGSHVWSRFHPISKPIVRILLQTVLIFFSTWWVARGFHWTMRVYCTGLGFASAAWRNSPTLMALRDEQKKTPMLYSNGSDVIFSLTGHWAAGLPIKYNPVTTETNLHYEEDLRMLRDDMIRHSARLVWLNRVDWRSYLPTLEDLTQALDLQVERAFADGAFYQPGTGSASFPSGSGAVSISATNSR